MTRAPAPIFARTRKFQSPRGRWRVTAGACASWWKSRRSIFCNRIAAFCGGYTEARKAAHLAQIYNLPVANGGGWPLFNMHTFAGLMNGWIVEWHLGMVQVGEMLFVDPPQPVNGMLKIPDAPGLGLKLNRDALRDSEVPA